MVGENPSFESEVLKAQINQKSHDARANDDSTCKHGTLSLWQDIDREVKWALQSKSVCSRIGF
jgi:hypothetical protein